MECASTCERDRRQRLERKIANLCVECGKAPALCGVLCPGCREITRAINLRKRLEVFEAYGGAICVCCGEHRIEFLTLDHIDGDGARHRLAIGRAAAGSTAAWAKRHGFPPIFRVLCFNCNASLGRYGYCPHELEPGGKWLGEIPGNLRRPPELRRQGCQHDDHSDNAA